MLNKEKEAALYCGCTSAAEIISGWLLGFGGNTTKVKEYFSNFKEEKNLLSPYKGISLRNHDLKLLLKVREYFSVMD